MNGREEKEEKEHKIERVGRAFYANAMKWVRGEQKTRFEHASSWVEMTTRAELKIRACSVTLLSLWRSTKCNCLSKPRRLAHRI